MAIFEVIKYDEQSADEFVWKHPTHDIVWGSQLIVNPSQEAIFIKGGKIICTYPPGTHTLNTPNLPFVRGIVNSVFGGKSPFSAEVWFIDKRIKRDLDWGTSPRLPIEDARYNLLVRISSYGNWGFQIYDSEAFLINLVGKMEKVNSSLIQTSFEKELMQQLSSVLSHKLIEEKISFSEINLKINEVANLAREAANAILGKSGVTIINFNLEVIEADDESVKAIQEVQRKVFEMEQFSKVNLTDAGVTIKKLDILNDAVKNNNGVAGTIIGGAAALGMALGGVNQAGQSIGDALKPAQKGKSIEERLQELDSLFKKGLLPLNDYDTQRQRIISEI